jgi:hypothetical protein
LKCVSIAADREGGRPADHLKPTRPVPSQVPCAGYLIFFFTSLWYMVYLPRECHPAKTEKFGGMFIASFKKANMKMDSAAIVCSSISLFLVPVYNTYMLMKDRTMQYLGVGTEPL